MPKHHVNKNQIYKNPKIQSVMSTQDAFEFKALPYSYNALEPFIDKLTVEIHYGKTKE